MEHAKTEMELLLELARANDRAHLAECRAQDCEVALARAEIERDEARRVTRVLAKQLDCHGEYFGVDQDEVDSVEVDVNTALTYPEAKP